MISKTDTQLSKALIDKRLVDAEAVLPLLDETSKSKESLFSLLVKKGLVTEDNLLKTASDVFQMPLIAADGLASEAGVTEKVPLKIAEFYKFLPLKIVKRKLTAAVSQPVDLRTQDDIRAQVGFELDLVLAREKDIAEALKKTYGFAAGTIGEIMAAAPGTSAAASAAEENFEKIENIEKIVGDASIVRLVNQIIIEAYRKRATDIHIEPYRGKVKLRYRIDGVLYNSNVQAEMARLILPILSRIKIMSNLNIVEKRLPQDGRAIVKIEDTQLDLRVSSIPTPYGESIVIRMLPMNRVFKLEQLGLNPEQLKSFVSLIEKPHGIIFITGPTGSGKSTTLYACLNRINTDERKIITIEDPVEYEMEGVTQIQVQGSIGLDFARGLRSMLRHDPDVMMVGEVRDLETAEMAIRVALTGHLVFSTLHTNDAASGITRLVDIGIQPYLVASSVEAFIAQRLVRVICKHCKEEDKTPAAAEVKKQLRKDLGLAENHPVPIYRGKGCNQCNDTGFWGRLAVYEVLLVTEPVKRLIMKRGTASEIKRAAVAQGMKTLKQDGWRKVLEGLTTPGEILEIAQEEKDAGFDEAEEPARGARSGDGAGQAVKIMTPTGGRPTEERAYPRIQEKVNVRYRIVKLPGQESTPPRSVEELTVTRDISAGGLVFVASDAPPMGAVLELKVELVEGDVECLARVVRVAEERENLYETAVCFLDLSRKDRSILEKFVARQLK